MNYQIQQLLYRNRSVTEQKALKGTVEPKHDTAIVLHIFYLDVWKELYSYLSQLTIPYDLYITVPKQTPLTDVAVLFEDHPDVTVYRTENRGRDVLPFLQVMRLIGTDSYRYLCKMHTKKTGDSALGNVWRKLLYYDLIGSAETVNAIIDRFETDPKTGMVTGKNTILDSKRYAYGNTEKIDLLAQKTGIVYDSYYLFPAGTMFWTRPKIVAPVVALLEKGELHFEAEAGQKDNTLAHAIERFFGILCQAQGMTITESPSRYSKLDDQTLDEVASLVLSQQYLGNDVFAMQKMKIEAQRNHIAYLEALADSMRLKNRMKHIVSDKLLPLGKKLAKIPSKLWKLIRMLRKNPSFLKKVFYYIKRGEFSYLLDKIKEKSCSNLSRTANLAAVTPPRYFTHFDPDRYKIEETVDIIIPVYNGYAFLSPLFDSIEEHTTVPYRLIVVHDCSPDERVGPYLRKRLEKHPDAVLIEHTQNQGFLKSVNEAYQHTQHHFVLLNTDTEVPKYWLERLMYPILHMEKVASTTPFTNAGQIASFPLFLEDNEIFDGMEVDALDSTFRDVNAENFYTEVPTGVGFCMGINRHAAKTIGMFDEAAFGKGYAEENDWCQRAIAAGYRNLIVPNLFVYHKHGGSFSSEEKQRLLQQNLATLTEKHPNYLQDVSAYIQKDPHRILRHLLVLKAADSTHGTTLIFDHDLGGGANLYVEERMSMYLSQNKSVLLIRYDFYSDCYILWHQYKTFDWKFKIETFETLRQFIETLTPEELFLNNLVSYKQPYRMLKYLDSLLQTHTHLPFIVPIHDFYAICPSYNLINAEGKYCHVPDMETCKACMQQNMQEWRNFYDGEPDIPQWRQAWEKLLLRSDRILCFSHNSREILLRAYPTLQEDTIEVVPHTVEGITPFTVEKRADSTTLTVGVLGAINDIKGAEIIKQMIQIIERDRLDINIVVIGEITRNIRSPHFHATGRYTREALPDIIQKHHIDIFLIPSIWPETFSYTSEEIMQMHLPLMVFDLGAPAERVKRYEKGHIIERVSAQAVIAYLQREIQQ